MNTLPNYKPMKSPGKSPNKKCNKPAYTLTQKRPGVRGDFMLNVVESSHFSPKPGVYTGNSQRKLRVK